jgi:hypothetical protein
MFAPPDFSATTSSTSKCTLLLPGGYGNVPSVRALLAFFWKKNGGSLVSPPISLVCSA